MNLLRLSLSPLGALAASLAVSGAAFAAQNVAPAFDLHPGRELIFAVTVEDGKVALSAPRAAKFGATPLREGEMIIGLTPRDKKTEYEQVIVKEKTSAPIDFVATALVGDVKIDERVLCGRLDGPANSRIGANNWRVRLHDFEVGKGGSSCE